MVFEGILVAKTTINRLRVALEPFIVCIINIVWYHSWIFVQKIVDAQFFSGRFFGGLTVLRVQRKSYC